MTGYACFPFVFGIPRTSLKYRLEKAENALIFQVLEQSPDITAFLKKYNFMASNGVRIAIDKYPEFKHSKNVIFLQGSDTTENFKLDTTRFVGKMQRDNAADMFNSALKELVAAVKGVATYRPYYGTAYGFTGGNTFKNSKTTIVVVE